MTTRADARSSTGSGQVVGFCVALIALSLLSACAARGRQPAQTSASAATTPSSITATTTAGAAPPSTPTARTQKWIDLQVGDCLSEPPPTDPSVATVITVDCAQPHRAEVYTRAPVGVNAAIADVADRACAADLSRYTGRALGDGAFSVTYLIDSNQDRTSDNPQPSTVICLLQPADGQPITGSARR